MTTMICTCLWCGSDWDVDYDPPACTCDDPLEAAWVLSTKDDD